MPFRNYRLLGDAVVEDWACDFPFRANRLITALEDFVETGAASLVAPTPAEGAGEPAVAVYLAPPRAVLRRVPDAAALLLTDHGLRSVEILEVIDDYGGADDALWRDIVARADRAIEIHHRE